MDLLQVMMETLTSAGVSNVFTSQPDGRTYPERVVLAFGAPSRRTNYFDGDDVTPLCVTCIVVRVAEYDAMTTAQECERILRSEDLDSHNGSYQLVSVDTSVPRPLPWDESGRFVWAFDTDIEILTSHF